MKIYYKNSAGKIIDFTKPPYKLLIDTDLFDYEWNYKIRGELNPQITRFYRGMTSKSVSVIIQNQSWEEQKKAVDNLFEIIENDIYSKTAGNFYIEDYYLPCYFVKSGKSNLRKGSTFFQEEFEIISEHGMWLKETNYVFRTDVSLPSTDGQRNLDYPYDFNYDFKSGMVGRIINNTGISPVDFEITMYGASLNPYINIGGETYRVYATLDTGEYLKINSVTKKIYKVKVNGEVVNQFNLRDREPDAFFRKVQPGINAVTWSGAYGVDVTLFEERSEPKWT